MERFKTFGWVAFQMVITAFIAGALAVATSRWSPTPSHAIWMFGLPVLIGCVANQTATMKVVMSVHLIICSLVGVIAAAAIYGLGP